MAENELKNLKIDPKLHQQLKIKAAQTKKTMRELAEAALRVFLAQPS